VAVEQTIDEVQVARTTTSGADRETARDMRVPAGGERGDFLVPDMQPLHAAMAAQCIGEAIEAVAYDSIDSLDTGGGEGFDHLVCNSSCHDILLTMGCMVLPMRKASADPAPGWGFFAFRNKNAARLKLVAGGGFPAPRG
jgi:hypothetical protein